VTPAWLTVVIAVISALTGIVGGVAVTLIRIRFDGDENQKTRDNDRERQERQLEHERSEQWVERLVRAADDFSTGISQALLGVHDAIAAVQNNGDRGKTQVEADRVIGEAIARVGRIKLLFGEESEPSQIASALLPQLSVALGFVKGGGAEVHARVPEAWKAIEKAYAQQRDFNKAALEMIHKPIWRVGANVGRASSRRVDPSSRP
jgi:hypothetical protein